MTKALTNFRLEEAERLIKWSIKNPGKWNNIINKDDMNTGEHLVNIIEILKEEEFYQIIFILLALNDGDFERQLCSREIHQVIREMIAEVWNKETIIHLSDRIIGKIRNEYQSNESGVNIAETMLI